MDLTFFLGKTLGLYILIMGILVLSRRKMIIHLAKEYVENKNGATTYFMSALLLIVGLAFVLSHNIWVGGFLPVVVTIFGWIILIKAFLLLFLPIGIFSKTLRSFEKNRLYTVFGAIYVVLGAYLTYIAFAL